MYLFRRISTLQKTVTLRNRRNDTPAALSHSSVALIVSSPRARRPASLKSCCTISELCRCPHSLQLSMHISMSAGLVEGVIKRRKYNGGDVQEPIDVITGNAAQARSNESFTTRTIACRELH